MTGPGAEPTRRPSSIPTRRAEAASISSKLLANYRGIVQCDGYAALQEAAGGQDHSSPSAGATCGASSSRSPSAAMRRSPPRRSRALPQLYAIEKDVRGTSADAAPCRAPGKIAPAHRRAQDLLRASARAALGRIGYGQDHPLRASGTGTASPASSTTAASSSTPTSSSAPCARIAMHESLCTPSSSVCKHWKCVRVGNATRATFSGHRRFDRLRRQVVGADLVWRAGNNLHRRKHAGFDQAAYRVVCDA